MHRKSDIYKSVNIKMIEFQTFKVCGKNPAIFAKK